MIESTDHTFLFEHGDYNYEVEVRITVEKEEGVAYSQFGGGTPDFEDRSYAIQSITRIDEDGNKQSIPYLPSELHGELRDEVNDVDINN